MGGCEKSDTKNKKEPFAYIKIPFKITGPEASFNDSVLISGYESDGRVESTWSIKLFSLKSPGSNESKDKFSMQNSENFTQEWIEHSGNKIEDREWGSSERMDFPSQYLDDIQDAFRRFIVYCDKAEGKDLGEERISMGQIDDSLKFDFIPRKLIGHALYVDYNGWMYAFYQYEDAKAFLKLLESKPKMLDMRQAIKTGKSQRNVKVDANIDDIFNQN